MPRRPALTGRGNPAGAHDLIIGATAIANGHAVATLNQRELARIPALRLVA